jgi:hypothetical protein
MGTVEERTPHFWRKVRYAYMDARRFANASAYIPNEKRNNAPNAFLASEGYIRPPVADSTKLPAGMEISEGKPRRTRNGDFQYEGCNGQIAQEQNSGEARQNIGCCDGRYPTRDKHHPSHRRPRAMALTRPPQDRIRSVRLK